ncbi:Ktr system potassium transporter B [Bacillus hwajinpoensis]|uniref:Ktr system potassium transporter B n=1 Tax=Guptibacillus hwajinpoensis TaxID=208199 RepID=A0A845F0N1_9BACL|nr:TrkH family potassium uptake protein [Pseudalkalibacillus hwajinpoensis]MYL64286.1 Ktr system potassium transporter B [Pseudalkalibacillus hwajinpoensis]
MIRNRFALKFIKLSPPQVLIFVFLILIILGTSLLKLPFATTGGITWVDALFTATSAMTVTGLVVIDTGEAFTLFGEIVIVSLIQLGGLGIMTFAVLIFMVLGRKIGMKHRLLVQQATNQTSIGGVVKLVKNILIFSLAVETVGFVILAARWVPEMGWQAGAYASFFHSISAFNNAGFSIWSNSLMNYVGDPIVNIVISFLFIVGGIGFTVLNDLIRSKTFREMALHSKVMLTGTVVINLIAMFAFFILEYHNPQTLANLSLGDKLWGSYFQAVTTRTAGFNSVDISGIGIDTAFFMFVLMFIGAGSTSTGGGIKLTTAFVIIMAVITFLRGKSDPVIYGRTIRKHIVLKALAITIISIMIVYTTIFILVLTEDHTFIEIAFEVISAFGTVGLSMGITGDLSTIGRIAIIFIMFLGKLGPLTLAFSLAQPDRTNIRYPDEDLFTG